MGICSSPESEVTIIGANGPQLRNLSDRFSVKGGIIRFSILGNGVGELIPDQNIKLNPQDLKGFSLEVRN